MDIDHQLRHIGLDAAKIISLIGSEALYQQNFVTNKIKNLAMVGIEKLYMVFYVYVVIKIHNPL